MRARKNPPPFTIDNLLAALKPGRVYSPEAIALKFGVDVNAARSMAMGAMLLGVIREELPRRGFRGGFWVPSPDTQRMIAGRRVGPLVTGGDLVGYEAQLWELHDLAMAARGIPDLARRPPEVSGVANRFSSFEHRQSGDTTQRGTATGMMFPPNQRPDVARPAIDVVSEAMLEAV